VAAAPMVPTESSAEMSSLFVNMFDPPRSREQCSKCAPLAPYDPHATRVFGSRR
jgi:hypothetical protein